MRILVIRLRLVGDVVFTTPVLRALRRAWPQAHLAYLVEAAAAPIVAHSPHLDEVIVIGRERGLARVRADLRVGSQLRRARYDIVLDLHGGPRAALLTWLSRSARRIGYSGQGRAWAYTERVHRAAELRPRHSVHNQWDILAPLLPQFAPPDPARDAVEMVETPAAASSIDQWLSANELASPALVLIVVHVSAGNAFRRWPLASFVELAVRLSSSSADRRIILTSGPSDAGAADAVAEQAAARLGARGDVVRTCGDTSLDQLRALMGRASLYIGGDSGPLHMAATTCTPIVGVYGPTLPVRSEPWRDPTCVTESVEVGDLPCRPCDQRVCVPGDFRCLTRISVGAVVAASERALMRARGSAN